MVPALVAPTSMSLPAGEDRAQEDHLVVEADIRAEEGTTVVMGAVVVGLAEALAPVLVQAVVMDQVAVETHVFVKEAEGRMF